MASSRRVAAMKPSLLLPILALVAKLPQPEHQNDFARASVEPATLAASSCQRAGVLRWSCVLEKVVFQTPSDVAAYGGKASMPLGKLFWCKEALILIFSEDTVTMARGTWNNPILDLISPLFVNLYKSFFCLNTGWI